MVTLEGVIWLLEIRRSGETGCKARISRSLHPYFFRLVSVVNFSRLHFPLRF
jgi:hypothetical protein